MAESVRIKLYVGRRVRPRRHASRKREGMPLAQLMKYAVPALLAFVSLYHQHKPNALFRDNPAPFWCFVAATAVYWLIAEAMKQMTTSPKRYEILRLAALASGIQSAFSLISMFLHHPLSLLPLLIFPIPFAIFIAYTRIIHPRVIDAINKIPRSRGLTNQPHEEVV